METQTKSKIKKIFGIVILVLIVALVLIAITVGILNKKKNRPTFIFGKAMLWVETGSMEPTISARSFILVERSNGEWLEQGDVIVFVCTDKNSAVYGSLITHRITDVTAEGFKTKGDNSNPDTWTVKKEDVVAVYKKNAKIFTYFGRLFSTSAGLILIFVLFFGSCVFIYIPEIIGALKSEEQNDKDKEIEKRVEEEVKKLIENDRRNDEK